MEPNINQTDGGNLEENDVGFSLEVTRPNMPLLQNEPMTSFEKVAEVMAFDVGGGPSSHGAGTTVDHTVSGLSANMAAAAAAKAQPNPQKAVYYPPEQSNGSVMPPTAAQRKELMKPKPPTYTEDYQNDNRFELVMLNDHFNKEKSHAQTCWACYGRFPRDNFMAPEDIAIGHVERYWIPEPGHCRYSAHGKMQKRLTHVRYSCMVNRYPYFSRYLLQISPEVRAKLNPEHRNYLWQQLGIQL